MYLSKVSIKVSSSYFNNNLIMEIFYSAFIHPCVSLNEMSLRAKFLVNNNLSNTQSNNYGFRLRKDA